MSWLLLKVTNQDWEFRELCVQDGRSCIMVGYSTTGNHHCYLVLCALAPHQFSFGLSAFTRRSAAEKLTHDPAQATASLAI
jgi:hypothetical protein